MELKCGFCNEIFSEDAMYDATRKYYAKTDLVVQKIGFSRKGKPKVKHPYICPKCKHIINNATIEIANEVQREV